MLDADGRGPAEEPLDFLRPGRGGEVVVGVGIPEERVAQGAADAPGLVAVRLERPGDLEHGLGDLEARRKAHAP